MALWPATEALGLTHLLDGKLFDATTVDDTAPGFLLRVTSTPPGARLWMDGLELGTTPVITNAVCREGQAVHLRLVKPGLPAWDKKIACQQGKTLLVQARWGD